MKRYWINHERGFANEYSLAVTEYGSMPEPWERITRARWIYLLRLRHNHAGAICDTGSYWASGDIGAVIEECRDATQDYLNNPEDGYVIQRL